MTAIHESGNSSAFENLVAVYMEGGRPSKIREDGDKILKIDMQTHHSLLANNTS